MSALVSTIIPVYNRPEQLQIAVRSVLSQTHPEIEVIIVDDGSDDATPEVIREMALDSRVSTLRINNTGPGGAREAGRQVARGEFLQYLDSDDFLYPGKFSRQVAALLENPESDVAYCRTLYRQGDHLLEQSPEKRTHERFDHMWPSFLTGRWWNTLTPLYRRSVCQRAGPWTTLRQEEDWEYDSRIATVGGRLCFVDEALCEFHHHGAVRLSGEGLSTTRKLADRASARRLIYNSAIAAGIIRETPEMAHFSRAAFLLARQCGAAGLAREAADLFDLARESAANPSTPDLVLFRAAAALIGWKNVGRLSEWYDRYRSGPTGSASVE